jgi:retron-type reverse transcriptase
MKTYGRLFDDICSFDNLFRAFQRARRRRSSRSYVQSFEHDLERQVLALREELSSGAYRPGPYREFYISIPKPRMISAAPFRDRVVHHALINVIGPIFDRSFLHDSYANQAGKGTHRAVARFQSWMRRYRFVLHADIRKYFPSIDHELLKQMMGRRIRCRRTLWLIATIIDHSNRQEPSISYFDGDDLFTPYSRNRGLPIGNLTSQFFANVYLNGLDHYVREVLRVPAYLRYVDDLAVFADDKQYLYDIRSSIGRFLESLRLDLNQTKSLVHRTGAGVRFLGYRVFPEFRLLPGRSVRLARRRFRRLAREYREGEATLGSVRASVNGWLGHVCHAQARRVTRSVLAEAVFVKG